VSSSEPDAGPPRASRHARQPREDVQHVPPVCSVLPGAIHTSDCQYPMTAQVVPVQSASSRSVVRMCVRGGTNKCVERAPASERRWRCRPPAPARPLVSARRHAAAAATPPPCCLASLCPPLGRWRRSEFHCSPFISAAVVQQQVPRCRLHAGDMLWGRSERLGESQPGRSSPGHGHPRYGTYQCHCIWVNCLM